jgi:1-acyl-sn-glycerol-3-phosphate acyltransferase
MLFGVCLKTERNNNEELYKEYFGPEYKITYDEGYSAIISNHTGWVDIICHLSKYSCGFIAKADVADLPLVGIIAKQIGCLFVKREDAENRNIIVNHFI